MIFIFAYRFYCAPFYFKKSYYINLVLNSPVFDFKSFQDRSNVSYVTKLLRYVTTLIDNNYH